MPNKPRNQLLVIIAFTDSFKIHVFFSQEAVSRAFLFMLYFIRNAWNLIGSKHCDCSQITKFLQIWAPQSIELTAKLERIQRLSIRFILNLPYSSTISYNILVYKLLPICYWDELLDLIFFFKVTHCFVNVDPSVLPDVRKFRWTS